MGYMRHDTIVVITWSKELAKRAHDEARRLFDIGSMGGADCMVTPIFETSINGQRAFYVLPDGSKEGWGPSDEGDSARSAFISWLDEQRHEDGSTSLHWVALAVGADDESDTRIAAKWSSKLRGKERSS